jgi:membrane protease YdiL (CAAX protease family)
MGSESNASESAVRSPALTFFGLMLLLVAAFTGLNFFVGFFRFYLPVAITLWMWIPGFAGLVTARYSKINPFRSKFPRFRFLALAVTCPLCVCGVVRGALWLSGLAPLQNDLEQMGLASSSRFWLGLLLSMAGAFGEEIGWRGFLGPQLARRLDFTGLVWCCWLPWFLFYLWLFFIAGAYSKTAFGLQLLTAGTLLFGVNVMLVWLRTKSGSLLPPVIFHTVHNVFAFNPLTLGSAKTPWLTGELGLGLACGYLAICFGVFWQGNRYHVPSDSGSAARPNDGETRVRPKRTE